MIIGVDTGGTFTDLVLLDADGRVYFDKAFSTPADLTRGVLAALERVAGRVGRPMVEVLAAAERFAHGTTVSTNALLQRRGARVGLLTTRGFEDTTLIARGPVGRTGGLPYALAMDFAHTEPPEPLVPRPLIRGLHERTTKDGRVLVSLDPEEVRRAVGELVAAGAESLAVCLLWSFRNPDHERLVGRVVRECAPGLPVSLSSEVSPLLGEFERATTTIVNAYIGPVTVRYLERLADELGRRGLRRPVQIMKCSGGLCLPQRVAQESVSIVNSGPVGGVVAARHLGELLGHRDIITTDMGGTSFDVGVIHGGEYEYERMPFLAQGLPVQTPALKVTTIGAGGGSIAWTDGRRLLVGPQSAGADPGPACYGRGGTEPTVTDALVVLGILDPGHFFGGRLMLERGLAEAAIRARIADPLGMSVVDAAAGIYEIVTARMADLVRKVSVESGYDPRHFALFSYGGAGPAHSARFARALGVREVVIPHAASVFSALGIALSDVLFTYARSEPLALEANQATADQFNAVFAELEAQAAADLAACGIPPGEALLTRRLDLRYQGQMNEITLAWDRAPLAAERVPALRAAFEDAYQARFGQGITRAQSPLEVISFRVEALRPSAKPDLRPLPERPQAPAPAPRATRRVFVHGQGWVPARVYDFEALEPGQSVAGTAIIERADTTVYIPAGQAARLDGYRNLRIQ